MMASTKPRSSMISASTMYITPMRLWSTLVSHSFHRYSQPLSQVMTRATSSAPPTVTNAPPAAMALYSGRDSMVSLPNITLSPRRRRRRLAMRLMAARVLVDDGVEELGLDRRVLDDGVEPALLGELGIG